MFFAQEDPASPQAPPGKRSGHGAGERPLDGGGAAGWDAAGDGARTAPAPSPRTDPPTAPSRHGEPPRRCPGTGGGGTVGLNYVQKPPPK